MFAPEAEDMFLTSRILPSKQVIRSYAPGSIDYQTAEMKQIDPLEVNATAELLEGQIRAAGEIATKVELVCARCLSRCGRGAPLFDLFTARCPRVKSRKRRGLKRMTRRLVFLKGKVYFWPMCCGNRCCWRCL